MKTCPYCAEEIQDEAIKCRHCRGQLDPDIDLYARQDVPRNCTPNQTRGSKGKGISGIYWVLAILVIIVTVPIAIKTVATLVTVKEIGRLDQANVISTKAQIKILEMALGEFRRDHGYYPQTEQGLKALIEKPTTGRIPNSYPKGGYLEGNQVPKDAWNCDFLYSGPGLHGNPYEITSMGADCQEGGVDTDADINSWEIGVLRPIGAMNESDSASSAVDPYPSINDQNWMQHPQIVAIRDIYHEIQKLASNREFTKLQRDFEYCEPYEDAKRELFTDSHGVVRMYKTQAGSEDSAKRFNYYYDQAGRLRFIFLTAGAVNGSELEHRVYFDEEGNRIWEKQKYLKGPGYTFPDVLPEDEIVRKPRQAFEQKNVCPESKTGGAVFENSENRV